MPIPCSPGGVHIGPGGKKAVIKKVSARSLVALWLLRGFERVSEVQFTLTRDLRCGRTVFVNKKQYLHSLLFVSVSQFPR